MIRVQVLKESEKFNIKKNSIVFLDDKIALKAVERGFCKIYCTCKKDKELQKQEEVIKEETKTKKNK